MKNTISKTNVISAIFIILGLICAIAFNSIGQTIDENGILHEPFGLIPLSYIFISLGFLLYIYGKIKR
ncbi:MAG: hypothetical protein CFH44_00822 [Proteobacteria bacterium]|jgi:hypothetical protein|nr:MAG: hypothetical protein CFH44_00822 [Pseudomonadota bacterium]|tara:strand:- start:180 stop:383 length:204 start_codon:yes stop_codon:yes gene_type:complete